MRRSVVARRGAMAKTDTDGAATLVSRYRLSSVDTTGRIEWLKRTLRNWGTDDGYEKNEPDLLAGSGRSEARLHRPA